MDSILDKSNTDMLNKFNLKVKTVILQENILVIGHDSYRIMLQIPPN